MHRIWRGSLGCAGLSLLVSFFLPPRGFELSYLLHLMLRLVLFGGLLLAFAVARLHPLFPWDLRPLLLLLVWGLLVGGWLLYFHWTGDPVDVVLGSASALFVMIRYA